MNNYTATITASGDGLQKLKAAGWLSKTFGESAGIDITESREQLKADNAAGYVEREVATISGSRDSFRLLARQGALPPPLKDAFEAADRQLDELTAARKWYHKLAESFAVSQTVGVYPIMETERFPEDFPDVRISVARYYP
jgi:hypothetical protein